MEVINNTTGDCTCIIKSLIIPSRRGKIRLCVTVKPVFTFVWAGVGDWPVYMLGRYSNLVQDGFRILFIFIFILWAGMH